MSNKKPTEVIGGEGADTRMGSRQDFSFDRADPLMNVGHSDLLKDAFPGRTQPIINDPVDGMPRPSDDRVQTNILPFNEDTFVCIEDERQWVEVFTEGDTDSWQWQVPLGKAQSVAPTRSRWDDNGDEREPATFKKDEVKKCFGLDVVITNGQMVRVRPIRQRCTFYTEQLAVADDVDATPLYRFCSAFRTLAGAHWSVFDESILACSARNPRDFVGEKQLVKRNRDKIEQGRNQRMIELIAPDTDHEYERVKRIAETATIDMCEFMIEAQPGYPSTVTGRMVLFTPFALIKQKTIFKPNMIVLPEKGFQPRDAWFEHKTFDGGEEFMKSGSGDTIVRIPIDEPAYTSDDDADTWPAFNESRNPMLRLQIMRNAEAAALALRNGKIVHVIGETIHGRPAFFAALTLFFVSKAAGDSMSGLDCLDVVESNMIGECVTNNTHRVFLKRMM